MTVACLVLLAVVIVASLVERQVVARAHARERREWTLERGSLLNRIKPEASQPPTYGPAPEVFQPVVTDEDYWADREN